MKSSELQTLFYKETGEESVNSMGNFIDEYTLWLQNKISELSSLIQRPAAENIFVRYVNVDHDNYAIVKATQEVLDVSEAEAVNILIEIGLPNILLHPDGDNTETKERVKEILSSGKYPELVERLKQSWCM